MSKRFDLEQSIMSCWNVTEDLKTVIDNLDNLSEDQLANALIGLQTMYEMKFNKLFADFEATLREKQI